ncbi:hypothetical protein MKY25_17890 [Geobacillus sp. FSL W8-0032]|uniref:DUF5050 domain-containing protein n=1 Tax=Geobacillus icigianus TaxID=1430331 RepID=A0ABU6BGA9_9BACL|nr:hypothetical protein [Geobacillus icigianus]MEB3750719.1 hypothetical protein [Geobacillus icigianus]
MRKIFLFCTVVLLSLLVGCSSVSTEQKKYITFPVCTNNDKCKILYHQFTQKLVAYNLVTHAIEQQTNRPNFFVYAFPTKCLYYTAGDSKYGHFSILKINGNEIEKLYSGRKGEAIFPLANDGSNYVFIKMYLDNKGIEISRTIARWDEKEKRLVEYPHVKGPVSYGAIIGRQLYYTAYNPSDDDYTMYVLDLSNKSNQPRLVEKGLKAGQLYVIDRTLYRSDQEKIYADNGRIFKKKLINYIDKVNRLLIQIYPNGDADLVLDIVKIDTNEKIASVKNVIDFFTERRKVIVYSLDGKKEIIVP